MVSTTIDWFDVTVYGDTCRKFIRVVATKEMLELGNADTLDDGPEYEDFYDEWDEE